MDMSSIHTHEIINDLDQADFCFVPDCERCDRPGAKFIRSRGMALCDDCAEELDTAVCDEEACAEQSTGCLALDAALMAAPNLVAVCDALKSHRAECVHCGSTAAPPRILNGRDLGPVCCEAA
jgi:hypothetical protein